jgi:hypothetical protein
MAYTIVGLFPSQEYSKAVSEGLENNGFKNENYIIYLEEKNILRSLFGVNFSPKR